MEGYEGAVIPVKWAYHKPAEKRRKMKQEIDLGFKYLDTPMYAESQPYSPNNPRSHAGQGGPHEAQRGGFMKQRRGYRDQGRSRGRFRGFYNRGGYQDLW